MSGPPPAAAPPTRRREPRPRDGGAVPPARRPQAGLQARPHPSQQRGGAVELGGGCGPVPARGRRQRLPVRP